MSIQQDQGKVLASSFNTTHFSTLHTQSCAAKLLVLRCFPFYVAFVTVLSPYCSFALQILHDIRPLRHVVHI